MTMPMTAPVSMLLGSQREERTTTCGAAGLKGAALGECAHARPGELTSLMQTRASLKGCGDVRVSLRGTYLSECPLRPPAAGGARGARRPLRGRTEG